jgi:hypothetical protein
MQSAGWIGLLERIPPAQHDNLMLMTSTGIEIALQGILRLEEEFVVVRGRLSGTDLGRIIFLPFNQISYLGFQKAVKEAEFRAMFGETGPAPAAAGPKPEPGAAAAPEPKPAESAPAPVPAPPAAAPLPDTAPASPAEGPPSSGRVRLPDKKAILERLRSRSQMGGLRPPVSP